MLPNVRKDALLTRQAKMINKFGSTEVGGKDIWNRVIISCKQSMNVARDTQGAHEAAAEQFGLTSGPSPVTRLGMRFMGDTSLSMKQQVVTLLSEPRFLNSQLSWLGGVYAVCTRGPWTATLG